MSTAAALYDTYYIKFYVCWTRSNVSHFHLQVLVLDSSFELVVVVAVIMVVVVVVMVVVFAVVAVEGSLRMIEFTSFLIP